MKKLLTITALLSTNALAYDGYTIQPTYPGGFPNYGAPAYNVNESNSPGQYIARPTLPGLPHAHIYNQPTYRIQDRGNYTTIQPTLPGLPHAPDYSRPGYVIKHH